MKVAENKLNFVCKNCGEAFTAFLEDMAWHNARVVCPRCGMSQDAADAMNLRDNLGTEKKASGRSSDEPHKTG